ncbi:MAG TPA: NlpC/P60 family protein [Thermomicrobiales bacterium]|nr:NlpC/P60 family protein [Thermomicrobiales bacterium]
MTLALGIPVAADLNLVPGEPAHVAYTNGDGVNVRDYPGYSGSIISTLNEGVTVTIVDGPMWLDDDSAWFLAGADTYDGYIEGWIVADYLSGEYVEPTYRETTSVVADGTTATVAGTDGYGLRLRDGATTDAGTITVMPEGATVGVLATEIYDASGASWANVTFDGMTGFAASAYLSIGGGSAPPAQPVADEPDSSGGLAIGDHAAVVGTGGGGLNLRDDASYNGGVVTILPEGVVVTIVDGPAWDGDGNGWYMVDYSSMTGWVHGGFLAWSDQAPSSDPTLDAVAQPVTDAPATEEPVTPEPTPAPTQQPVDPEPVAPETGVGAIVVSEALNFVGTPYVWGGTTPGGFDCSGFTYYIFNNVAGVGLSRSLEVQASSGSYVNPENLQPGDLIFQQNTYKWGLSHVGIYIGGGQMVNAQSERVGVAIADIWDSYWGPRYYTARRVV